MSMQFMLLVLGRNEAHAIYACPFCTVHKDENTVFICMYAWIDGIHQSQKYCTQPPRQEQLHHFGTITGFKEY